MLQSSKIISVSVTENEAGSGSGSGSEDRDDVDVLDLQMEVDPSIMEEGGVGGQGQGVGLCGISGEGDVAPRPRTKLRIDKIFTGDRLVKFDDKSQLVQGHVVIGTGTGSEVKIDWDDQEETLLRRDWRDGQSFVTFRQKVGIFDRCTVGFGSKISDASGTRFGTVREKRFVATLALEGDGNYVLPDTPCEQLLRYGHYQKDDKIIYDKEWIGLVVDTRAKTTFRMEKDGAIGQFANCSFGYKFPHPGERIPKMMISYLWDSEWEDKRGFWLWKVMKYLTDPATVLKTELDLITVAWMGRISDSSGGLQPDSPCPPAVIRSPQISKVEYMYGRAWKYMRELETYEYELKEGDSFLHYDTWIKKLSDEHFFGLRDNEKDRTIDIHPNEDGENGDGEACPHDATPGRRIYVKLVMWRSVVDVEWDDGGIERSIPSYMVKPYSIPPPLEGFDSSSLSQEGFSAGDIVVDKNQNAPKNSLKYGMVRTITCSRQAMVKWIIPDPAEQSPPVVREEAMELYDLALSPKHLFLRCLYQLPVVVVKNPGQKSDQQKLKVGLAVGIDVAQGKMIVKDADEIEHAVWCHEYVHLVGDVMWDARANKWVKWMDPEAIAIPMIIQGDESTGNVENAPVELETTTM